MIWKEHNKIIFENSHLSAQQLARMAKEEIQLHLCVLVREHKGFAMMLFFFGLLALLAISQAVCPVSMSP
jgi:hypothetical protein